MIRRDIRLADGAAGWMLVSQVEHARVSAELAARCTGSFAASNVATTVRAEILAAIARHDDGWIEWEKSPQLDPAAGRPLSFTELGAADALSIWSRSIEAAAAIGPLAAWMVASHFLRLASHSDSAQADSAFAHWRDTMERRRGDWLAEWEDRDPARHSRAAAAEAFQWLWTFDEASLWLCCTCSSAEPIPCAPEPYRAGRGTPIEMDLQVVGPETATAGPWRFDEASFCVSIPGLVVPATRYPIAGELLAQAVPGGLKWQFGARKKLLETRPTGRS